MGAYKNEKINVDVCQKNVDEWASKLVKHTHCSLLFEAGASLKEVLGHSMLKQQWIFTHTLRKKQKTKQF